MKRKSLRFRKKHGRQSKGVKRRQSKCLKKNKRTRRVLRGGNRDEALGILLDEGIDFDVLLEYEEKNGDINTPVSNDLVNKIKQFAQQKAKPAAKKLTEEQIENRKNNIKLAKENYLFGDDMLEAFESKFPYDLTLPFERITDRLDEFKTAYVAKLSEEKEKIKKRNNAKLKKDHKFSDEMVMELNGRYPHLLTNYEKHMHEIESFKKEYIPPDVQVKIKEIASVGLPGYDQRWLVEKYRANNNYFNGATDQIVGYLINHPFVDPPSSNKAHASSSNKAVQLPTQIENKISALKDSGIDKNLLIQMYLENQHLFDGDVETIQKKLTAFPPPDPEPPAPAKAKAVQLPQPIETIISQLQSNEFERDELIKLYFFEKTLFDGDVDTVRNKIRIKRSKDNWDQLETMGYDNASLMSLYERNKSIFASKNIEDIIKEIGSVVPDRTPPPLHPQPVHAYPNNDVSLKKALTVDIVLPDNRVITRTLPEGLQLSAILKDYKVDFVYEEQQSPGNRDSYNFRTVSDEIHAERWHGKRFDSLQPVPKPRLYLKLIKTIIKPPVSVLELIGKWDGRDHFDSVTYVNNLAKTFQYKITVLGSGDCYYRSVIVGFMYWHYSYGTYDSAVALLINHFRKVKAWYDMKKEPRSTEPIPNFIKNANTTCLTELIKTLNHAPTTFREFVDRMNNVSSGFDNNFVQALRYSISCFIWEKTNDEFKGLIIALYNSVDEFLLKKVNKMMVDAEDYAIQCDAIPFILQAELEIVDIMNRTYGVIRGGGNHTKIALCFSPGHYDVFTYYPR
jgi:hypothetical protein